ncbi:hypothetical protein [Laceyella tengchongensis]|uniref:hypothetical protein n=1 Tax=Laceyella tengchongensis TaxID=574699 RepID=UPI001E31E585
MFKGKWKISTMLLLSLIIHLAVPHIVFAQIHTLLETKTEKMLLTDGIEIPTIPSNDPIEIPSDPIEIPKVEIPNDPIEIPKAEIPKAPVQESTSFIEQLLEWLGKQLSLILTMLCLGLALFFLSANPILGTSIMIGMAFGGLGAWMADEDVSGIAQAALIGGIAGLVGLGAGALAFRLIGGRIATMAHPWLGKWLPFIGSGGAAGVADSVSFDYMRDGKVDWKKAGLAGLLSVVIGFAGLGIVQYGGKFIAPTIVSKINDIPLTTVSVFKDGTASAPKTIGDTSFGAWLQKFSSNGESTGIGEAGKIIGKIVKEKDKTTYTNPAGNELIWVDQHPKNINRDIDNALKSSNVGKATEAKVADFVRKEKDVIGFGLRIEWPNGKTAGDLDVVTKDEIIEVKASISAFKRKPDQFDKFTNVNNTDFFNSEQKKVILYVDKPLTNLHPNDQKILETIKSKGVTIVNSLDELKEVLK